MAGAMVLAWTLAVSCVVGASGFGRLLGPNQEGTEKLGMKQHLCMTGAFAVADGGFSHCLPELRESPAPSII